MGSLSAFDPGRIRRKAKRSERASELEEAKASEAKIAAAKVAAAEKEAADVLAAKKKADEAAFNTLGAKRDRAKRAASISTSSQGILGEPLTGRRRLSAG